MTIDAASPTPTASPPGFWRSIGRALCLRCPWCGGRRAWLRGWFGRDPRCHTCGMRYERGMVGFELGSMTMNVIATFGAIIAVMVVGVVLTYPDIAAVPLAIAAAVIGIAMPILAYPFTQTLWFAVDLRMRPPDPGEIADADGWVAAGRPPQVPRDRRRSR